MIETSWSWIAYCIYTLIAPSSWSLLFPRSTTTNLKRTRQQNSFSRFSTVSFLNSQGFQGPFQNSRLFQGFPGFQGPVATLKRIEKEDVSFRFNIEYAPPMFATIARAVIICNDKWIFSLFSWYHGRTINKFIHIIWWKKTHKIIIYVLIFHVFKSIFNLRITDSLAPFLYSTKKII